MKKTLFVTILAACAALALGLRAHQKTAPVTAATATAVDSEITFSMEPEANALSFGSFDTVTISGPTCPGGHKPQCVRCDSGNSCVWSCNGGYTCYYNLGPAWLTCYAGNSCWTS